jgi:hypothetical protein
MCVIFGSRWQLKLTIVLSDGKLLEYSLRHMLNAQRVRELVHRGWYTTEHKPLCFVLAMCVSVTRFLFAVISCVALAASILVFVAWHQRCYTSPRRFLGALFWYK